jgi:hypothetical protein
MIVKLHTGIEVGEYIQPTGHNVKVNQKWWKVIDRDGPRADTLIVVDRHGYRREFYWTQGRKYKVWQPGDPRND